jgi:RNA-dependent RNA polymerase
VVCASAEDLEFFRVFCRVEDHGYHIVYRDLFSETAMSAVQRSLEELDWPVAFQLESLLRGMAIDYVEANQLIPEIQETIRSKGKLFTANSIRNFKNEVKSHFHHEDEDEASFDIVQLFRQTVTQQSDLDNLVSSRRGDNESLHVEVTPTTMFLSGPFPERSNRVIRAYDTENQENFLRVSFVDERGLHIRSIKKLMVGNSSSPELRPSYLMD